MAMSQFTEVWMWYIDAAIIGVASSVLFFIPVPILIGNWFKKRQGLALSIAAAFAGIGGAIMVPILTNVIATFGWQTAYVVAGIVCLVFTIPASAFILKFKPADKGLTPYGSEDVETVATSEAKMNVGMSASRAVKTGLVVLIFIMAGLFSLENCFSSHLPGFGTSAGLDPTMFGLLSSCAMIGNIATKLIVGPLCDKLGIKVSLILVSALVILGTISMIFSGGQAIMMFIGAACYGASFAPATVVLPIAIRKMVGNKDFPKIYSYATMGTAFVGSLGIPMVGMIFDASGNYMPALLVVDAIIALGVVFLFINLWRSKKIGFDKEEETAVSASSASE
jgi:MFS family permease